MSFDQYNCDLIHVHGSSKKLSRPRWFPRLWRLSVFPQVISRKVGTCWNSESFFNSAISLRHPVLQTTALSWLSVIFGLHIETSNSGWPCLSVWSWIHIETVQTGTTCISTTAFNQHTRTRSTSSIRRRRARVASNSPRGECTKKHSFSCSNTQSH